MLLSELGLNIGSRHGNSGSNRDIGRNNAARCSWLGVMTTSLIQYEVEVWSFKIWPNLV